MMDMNISSWNFRNVGILATAALLPMVSNAPNVAADLHLSFGSYHLSNASFSMLPRTTDIHQDICYSHKPRTALGAKLLALRRAYIENGGVLLDGAVFDAELHNRRGGISA